MGVTLSKPSVPSCGFGKMKVCSHKPWNENQVNFSTIHILKHVAPSFLYTLRTNSKVFLLLVAYVFLIGGALGLNLISFATAIFVTVFLFALIIGLVVKNAKKEITVEGLQMWFKDAYGLLVPYEEAAIAYANFVHSKIEYELPNKGVLSRVNSGLIYTAPTVKEN